MIIGCLGTEIFVQFLFKIKETTWSIKEILLFSEKYAIFILLIS